MWLDFQQQPFGFNYSKSAKAETCRTGNFLYGWDVARTQTIQLAYRPYRRSFARPLSTAWGTWSVREGIIIRYQDTGTGATGYGEVAPLPHFGSEDLFEAVAFLGRLSGKIDVRSWASLLQEAPPATAFGLWTAAQGAQTDKSSEHHCHPAALMVLGRGLKTQIPALRANGFRTFKLKLGLKEAETEVGSMEEIAPLLGKDTRVRLDPNRSWDQMTWNYWRPWLEHWRHLIEFVEEPFIPATKPAEMIKAASESPVPLALDESLSERGIYYWIKLGWPGYWVIKPSLTGDPTLWMSNPALPKERVVLSSAFETGIGLSSLVNLASTFPETNHGLGTQAWFTDTWRAPELNGRLYAMANGEQQQLWNSLPTS